MNACPLYVKINYLFCVDLATDSKSVAGGQCTAGWSESKEENYSRSIMCGPDGKRCESFHRL